MYKHLSRLIFLLCTDLLAMLEHTLLGWPTTKLIYIIWASIVLRIKTNQGHFPVFNGISAFLPLVHLFPGPLSLDAYTFRRAAANVRCRRSLLELSQTPHKKKQNNPSVLFSTKPTSPSTSFRSLEILAFQQLETTLASSTMQVNSPSTSTQERFEQGSPGHLPSNQQVCV